MLAQGLFLFNDALRRSLNLDGTRGKESFKEFKELRYAMKGKYFVMLYLVYCAYDFFRMIKDAVRNKYCIIQYLICFAYDFSKGMRLHENELFAPNTFNGIFLDIFKQIVVANIYLKWG